MLHSCIFSIFLLPNNSLETQRHGWLWANSYSLLCAAADCAEYVLLSISPLILPHEPDGFNSKLSFIGFYFCLRFYCYYYMAVVTGGSVSVWYRWWTSTRALHPRHLLSMGQLEGLYYLPLSVSSVSQLLSSWLNRVFRSLAISCSSGINWYTHSKSRTEKSRQYQFYKYYLLPWLYK